MDWIEKDTDLFEERYESDTGSSLYIEDTYKNSHPENQTELSDWNDERYEVKLQKWYRLEPTTLKEGDSFEELEEFVDDIVGMDYSY